MPTACELVVLGPVTRLTIERGDLARQLEVVVSELILTVESLVTVVTGDVGLAVLAAFELVDDGRRLFPVALRASPGGLREGWELLTRLACGSRTVDQERRQDQAAPDHDGDED